MKNSVLVVSFLLLAISMGCKKNDDTAPMEIALQNEPPLSFNLIDVPDGATDVDVTPNFSWESAENPKGSGVTYDLYLDQSLNPTTLVESNISKTSLEIDQSLKHLSEYHWKVVATDSEGQASQSPIHQFSTRYYTFPEEPVTRHPEFSGRRFHAAAVLGDKIWLSGGSNGGERKNDVWYSQDGENWTQATTSANFPKRYRHKMLAFDGKLWVIGGLGAGELYNDVWYSENGKNWSLASAFATYPERRNHGAVVFDDKIWVIGGRNQNWDLTNDVWHSTDGVTWTSAILSADFSEREEHATAVFKDKIWVIGGNVAGGEKKNDVWYSSDGTNWESATSNAGFAPRRAHEAFVFDDKIWIIGGWGITETFNDVWYSSNGVDWVQAAVSDSFPGMARLSANIFKDRVWLIDSANQDERNEIWAMH